MACRRHTRNRREPKWIWEMGLEMGGDDAPNPLKYLASPTGFEPVSPP